MDIVETVTQLGVTAAMLVYFVWQNKIDRDKLMERVTDMENYIREKLEGALQTSNSTVEKNTRAMERVVEALDRREVDSR